MTSTDHATPDPVRLNRYLAQCGLGSRRSVERLIAAGHILVNGREVTGLGGSVLPGVDTVVYKGKTLTNVRAFEYYAYHKPAGIIVTKADPEGRETVFDAIARDCSVDVRHLNYVGRLDVNSEGLLLFTNDGAMIHGLTHPRFRIKKVYLVKVDRPVDAAHTALMLGDGVVSEGQTLHAGAVRRVDDGPGQGIWYEVTLYEGKNRQVRRMFDAFGYAIARLVRIQFGSVRLGELQPCSVRHLTAREIAALTATGFPAQKRR
jgi:23S rRNA pseudouridine2605 synthase